MTAVNDASLSTPGPLEFQYEKTHIESMGGVVYVHVRRPRLFLWLTALGGSTWQII
ncbi:hypothetical protein ACTPOE_11450 [Castellaniella sp. WN]